MTAWILIAVGSLGALAGVWTVARLIIDRWLVQQRKAGKARRIGVRLSDVLPGWSYPRCMRCRTSYRYVPVHELRYEGYDERGLLKVNLVRILCEPCHRELETPGNRIGYYMTLLDENGGSVTTEDEMAIRAAVQVGA